MNILKKKFNIIKKIIKNINDKYCITLQKNKISTWLNNMGIDNYIITNELIVHVHGNVDLKKKNLTEIPIKFGEILGYFNCSYNNLKSLKGIPDIVYGYFDCSHNDLESLEFGPKEVITYYNCSYNNLKSLKHYCYDANRAQHTELNYLETPFYKTQSWLKNNSNIRDYTINEDLTVDIHSSINIWPYTEIELPIKFGIVKGDFNCFYGRNLKNLKGFPTKIEGNLTLTECGIENLNIDELPLEIYGNINFEHTTIKLKDFETMYHEIRNNSGYFLFHSLNLSFNELSKYLFNKKLENSLKINKSKVNIRKI